MQIAADYSQTQMACKTFKLPTIFAIFICEAKRRKQILLGTLQGFHKFCTIPAVVTKNGTADVILLFDSKDHAPRLTRLNIGEWALQEICGALQTPDSPSTFLNGSQLPAGSLCKKGAGLCAATQTASPTSAGHFSRAWLLCIGGCCHQARHPFHTSALALSGLLCPFFNPSTSD